MRKPLLALALLPILAQPACDMRTPAMGAENRFIVGASTDLWEQIDSAYYEVLEGRFFTTRPENAFQVTHQDPADPETWANLRRFRREIVIGTGAEPWVQEALAMAPIAAPEAPAILQVDDVWAQGQQVTIVLVPEGNEAAGALEVLPALEDLFDGQYREWVRTRMFVSGRDTMLSDSIADRFGFRIVVPDVYRWSTQGSVVRFRNDNPSPSELIRELNVTWRPADSVPTSVDEIRAWRDELSTSALAEAQQVDTIVAEQRVTIDGETLTQIQGVWSDVDPEWPASGVFYTRIIPCPAQDRTYLLDAWLYAPGVDKYQYLIQLQTLMNTFRCSG